MLNKMSGKGLLIVIDGPSGSGKDSVVKQVIKDLRKLNIGAISIQETKEKDYNREKILAAKGFGDKKTAEAIIRERRKIYQAKILPKLLDGKLVIANRGEPTTLTYQTLGKEMVMDDLWKMHRNANIPPPDLAIILTCSANEALRRESLKKTSSNIENKNSLSGAFTQNLKRRKQIHTNYEKTKNFLEKKGLFVIYLQNDALDVREESKIILNYLKNKLDYQHE